MGLWYRSKRHRPDVNSPSPLWNSERWRWENVLEVWLKSHATCHLLHINDMSSDDPPLLWPINLSVTGRYASTGAIWFLFRPRITDGIHVCNDRCIYCGQIKKDVPELCKSPQVPSILCIILEELAAYLNNRGWTCSESCNSETEKWRNCERAALLDPNWLLQSALHCSAIFQQDSLPYFLQRAASLSRLKANWN